MLGNLAVTRKQQAMEKLEAVGKELSDIADWLIKNNYWPAKDHVEGAWRCIEYAKQVVNQPK